VALVAGEKASPDALARARRVDIRLLAPWSSWEDTLSRIDPTAREQTATAVPELREPATISSLPVQTEPMQLPQPVQIDAPAREGVLQLLKTITPQDLGG